MRVQRFGVVLMIACAALAQTQTQPVQAVPTVRELTLVAGRGELLQFASEV